MVTWLLATVCLALLGLLMVACVKIEHAQSEARSEAQRHNGCHVIYQAATEAVGAVHDAALLRRMAEKYDTSEVQMVEMQVIGREKYKVGGPSMPALWLLEQARKIEDAL